MILAMETLECRNVPMQASTPAATRPLTGVS
jgi:hypothetical protein